MNPESCSFQNRSLLIQEKEATCQNFYLILFELKYRLQIHSKIGIKLKIFLFIATPFWYRYNEIKLTKDLYNFFIIK